MIKDTYKFELIVEIDGRDILEYCQQNVVRPMEAIQQITSTMYLGLSCIDGMLSRQFEITNTDSYVHSITDEDGNEQ